MADGCDLLKENPLTKVFHRTGEQHEHRDKEIIGSCEIDGMGCSLS